MFMNKKRGMSVALSLSMIASFSIGNVGLAYGATGEYDYTIANPYETVDWDTHGQYKANFHSHTTESDGGNTAKEMIEDHYAKGYDILAITDHNFTNTTWDRTDRPATNADGEKIEYLTTERMNEINSGVGRDGRGMISIPYSNEQSRSDHLNTFWTDFNNSSGATLEGNILAAEDLKGISHINHPGRYTGGSGKTNDEGVLVSSHPETISKYVDLFERYDSLTGMEIINKKDGDSASDRILWDNILKQTMPECPVWGYSNDDTHSVSATGFSYNMMLMPENTAENVRYSMENGTFYAVAKVAKRELGGNFVSEGPTPEITDISVDNEEDSITIEGNHYNTIEWIADGQVIATGNTIDLDDFNGKVHNYVRAQLKGNGGISFTQPFGVIGGAEKPNVEISEIELTADSTTISTVESTSDEIKLNVSAKDAEGENIDLANAIVLYRTDSSGIVSVADDGTLTVANTPIANMKIKVWAEVIIDSQLVKSNELAISIDTGVTGNYAVSYIKDGNDDVEEYVSNGRMYLNNSDLEIVWESPTKENKDEQTIGLRYTGLMIPQGAKITNAYLQFTVDEANKSADPFNVQVYAEDTDNSLAFEEINYNLSSRTRTTSFIDWKDIPVWTVEQESGEEQRTNDLSAVLQEVIDREGWNEGNALTFILTGTGNRTAEAYERWWRRRSSCSSCIV